MNLPITGYKAKSEYTHPNGTKSIVYLMDNMDFMEQVPPKFFELACVDPPYGIGEDGRKGVRTSPSRPNSYLREPKYKAKGWDNSPPDNEYFNELLRVSKNTIIWGANHFIENIPNQNSSCWLVWDKKNEGTDFADCELAILRHAVDGRKLCVPLPEDQRLRRRTVNKLRCLLSRRASGFRQ